MDLKLVVVGGKANKGRIALKLPTMIGRSREAGLTISHPMVSRRHCEMFEVDGLLKIRDLGSLNGTVVDGQRITEASLPPDGEFTIGPLTFRAEYEYEGDAAGAVPTPKTLPPAPQTVVDAPRGTPAGASPDFQALDETPRFPRPVDSDAATDDSLPSTPDWEHLAAEAASSPDAEGDLSEEKTPPSIETPYLTEPNAAQPNVAQPNAAVEDGLTDLAQFEEEEVPGRKSEDEPTPTLPPVIARSDAPPIKKKASRWSSGNAEEAAEAPSPANAAVDGDNRPGDDDRFPSVGPDDKNAPPINPNLDPDDDLDEFLNRF